MNILKAFSYGVLVPIFAYTQVPQELVILASIMITIDIITGIIREWILGQFRSRELMKGLVSKFILMLVPFIMAMVGKGIGIDMTIMVKMVLSTFIVAEAYSSIGNIVQIRKGTDISEQDSITFVLQKAQDVIKNVLDSIMTNKKN